ncbi:MAG: ATP-dependent DNA helicase [Acidimicrobiales bacterium]
MTGDVAKAEDVATVLAGAASLLPGGGEHRPGQGQMAEAVNRSISTGRHLVVQAGTGTGKSLAYLVPVAVARVPAVVATATKALQDQLAEHDLPLVARSLGGDLTYAVLKGRSNYLCRQRVAEVGGHGEQLSLGDVPPAATTDSSVGLDRDGREAPSMTDLESSDHTSGQGSFAEQLRRLIDWGDSSATGDRSELDFEPQHRVWAMVSTTANECPGASRCPSGDNCFAERARIHAAEADVVVVNTHLYGAHLASGGTVLPPHDLVVFDEAHEVEAVMTEALGAEITPGRFRALALSAGPALEAAADAAAASDAVADLEHRVRDALAGLVGERIDPVSVQPVQGARSTGSQRSGAEARTDDAELELSRAHAPGADGNASLRELIVLARSRISRLVDHLHRSERRAGTEEDAASRSRRDRALLAAAHLEADLDRLSAPTDDDVVWVDGDARTPSLRVSPIEVGPVLAELLWSSVTGVLTSATVPVGLARRLGVPAEGHDDLDVGSPFAFRDHALLYVARDLPDRRRPESEPALHDELGALIEAAGGRTLALFTSWRAMRAAAEAVRSNAAFPVLIQDDLPKPALVEVFRNDEATCLFATLGFWQGIDVPGRTLSLVTIDRIPFPRPDHPVLQARRERAGPAAFTTVDLPRAGTLLAQGAGRLIRSGSDRGVVAVLDSRLATASYRKVLLARVPPMRRTVDRSEVEEFLRQITRS